MKIKTADKAANAKMTDNGRGCGYNGAEENNGAPDSTPEILINSAKAGERHAFVSLTRIYEPLFASLLARYCREFPQSERDDVRQELSIAFYNAVISYDTRRRGVEFGLYAKICMVNRMTSVLRRQNRQSLCIQTGLDEAQTEIQSGGDPSQIYEIKEDLEAINKLIDENLSEYEAAVLRRYVSGYPAKETAVLLGKDEKSVENALFRVRTKLKKALG